MRTAPTIVTACALLVAITACGADSSTPDGRRLVDGGTFTMVLTADPGNLDPHLTSLSPTLQVDRFLYDSLVTIDESGAMTAGLAQTWTATPTEAVFTLRAGITCADGSPLTAGTVARNIAFVADPANGSSRLGIFVPPGASATADDTERTVTVTVPAATAFLDRMVGGLHIVCDRGLADRSMLARGADGTGMFTLTEAVPDDHYTLTRRREYAWGPGDWRADQPGLPDTVVLRVIPNETTAANLLLSDQVNAATVAGADGERLRARNLFAREVLATAGQLWFNQRAGMPGASDAVRRALTQALDLRALAQVVTGGQGRPSTSLVAPGLGPCGLDTVTAHLPGHDVAAAGAALDRAGYPAGADGRRPLSLALYYPSSLGPRMQAGAELAQQAWSGLGITVTLTAVTEAEIGTQIIGGQGAWSVAFVPLGVVLPSELVPFFSGSAPPDGMNFAAVSNDAYMAATGQAASLSGDRACAEWAAAEEALLRDLDVVPFADGARPTFGTGAEFALSQGSVLPGSIRMLR
ncbi:ABC transporter substrate-binding protein [Catenuloplanes atrovinosus]|uniref:Peptide/nickel transport system substrate-binding protein n=1 Tax=Catenuloplanes atrovinosus TaxID=137266 RepID=A0AAE3YQ78_9ACTN|nr:ABC transporter substrate-binding protein [Catenuloplanes atrovinosus]MDR7277267.1 peptide/nickel transport system substrate-binding protein [Catenuloplanes atrovinosus]